MGQPKAWLPIGAEMMLQRIVSIVRQVVQPVVVVAARDQELPILPCEIRIVRDVVENRGPLQGLLAGLTTFQGQVDCAWVCSCDMPLLRPAFIQRMIDLLGSSEIAVPRIDDRPHPLAAVYRPIIRSHIEDLLTADQLRMTSLLDLHATRLVEAAELADVDPELDSLRNVNTPEDYAAVLRDLNL